MRIELTDLSGARTQIETDLIKEIKSYRTCSVISLSFLGSICVRESVSQIKAKMFGRGV